MRTRFPLSALAALLLLSGCASRGAEPSPPPPPPAAATAAPSVQPEPVSPAAPVPVPARTAPEEYEAGLALLKERRYFEAALQLERAVVLDPSYYEAWNQLSYARLREDGSRHANAPGVRVYSYESAINAARQALTIRPDSGDARYNLGLALLANGEYQEAVQPLRLAAEQQLGRGEPLAALGLAYLGTGERETAVLVCREAKRLAPDYLPAHRCLEEAGEGFTRLPDKEAAVGQMVYRPERRTFVWTGPAGRLGQPEYTRVSPPWTCSMRYPLGYIEAMIGCGGRAATYTYAWIFNTAAMDLTPAQIGVGQPWEKVEQIYGPTYQTPDTLHYAVADLHMVFRRSPQQQTIASISFEPVSPLFAIEDLLQGKLYPQPFGTAADKLLAGIRLGQRLDEAEAILGKHEAEASRGEHGAERTYRKGQVRVLYGGSPGFVQAVTLTGQGSTLRGVAIGDPADKVLERYGRPSDGQRYADQEQALEFRVRNGRVYEIHLARLK